MRQSNMLAALTTTQYSMLACKRTLAHKCSHIETKSVAYKKHALEYYTNESFQTSRILETSTLRAKESYLNIYRANSKYRKAASLC